MNNFQKVIYLLKVTMFKLDCFLPLNGQSNPPAGMTDQDSDVTYAYVDCWVRLRVPMEQALRQYKVSDLLTRQHSRDAPCLYFCFFRNG